MRQLDIMDGLTNYKLCAEAHLTAALVHECPFRSRFMTVSPESSRKEPRRATCNRHVIHGREERRESIEIGCFPFGAARTSNVIVIDIGAYNAIEFCSIARRMRA